MLVIATIVHVRYRVIIQSVYLLYGNVRPKGCLKKEVVIMLKNLIFFLFFFLFCFVCLFVFCLRGGEHASQGNGGSISRYQLSIKGELQRIDSQWEGIFRILWSLMEDQGIFVVTQPKSSHSSPLPSPSLPELQIPTCLEYLNSGV